MLLIKAKSISISIVNISFLIYNKLVFNKFDILNSQPKTLITKKKPNNNSLIIKIGSKNATKEPLSYYSKIFIYITNKIKVPTINCKSLLNIYL